MVVADDKLDAAEAVSLQPGKKLGPARPALAVSELDRQDLAPAILVDRHPNKNGLAGDDPGFAYLFVARVEDQIGVALVDPPPGNAFSPGSSPGDLLIALIDEAEKLCPAQPLGHRFNAAFAGLRGGELLMPASATLERGTGVLGHIFAVHDLSYIRSSGR
jgi:hypothetical protein